MVSRAKTQAAAALVVGGLVLGAPALVEAQSGGASPSGGATPGGQGQPTASPKATASPKSGARAGTVSASGNGITVATHAAAILRKPLAFSGNAGRRAAGSIVEIERRGRETHWKWAPTTHDTVASNGSFSAVWPTNHIGRFSIRAVLEHSLEARAAAVSPSVTITVYRPSLATIYGPGFWGSRTACGQTLRRGTIGVANRTLPCGTSVALYYGGRTMVVRVIDRGPYAHGADWDLTEATARALGVDGTATIGAVSLPGRR